MGWLAWVFLAIVFTVLFGASASWVDEPRRSAPVTLCLALAATVCFGAALGSCTAPAQQTNLDRKLCAVLDATGADSTTLAERDLCP